MSNVEGFMRGIPVIAPQTNNASAAISMSIIAEIINLDPVTDKAINAAVNKIHAVKTKVRNAAIIELFEPIQKKILAHDILEIPPHEIIEVQHELQKAFKEWACDLKNFQMIFDVTILGLMNAGIDVIFHEKLRTLQFKHNAHAPDVISTATLQEQLREELRKLDNSGMTIIANGQVASVTKKDQYYYFYDPNKCSVGITDQFTMMCDHLNSFHATHPDHNPHIYHCKPKLSVSSPNSLMHRLFPRSVPVFDNGKLKLLLTEQIKKHLGKTDTLFIHRYNALKAAKNVLEKIDDEENNDEDIGSAIFNYVETKKTNGRHSEGFFSDARPLIKQVDDIVAKIKQRLSKYV